MMKKINLFKLLMIFVLGTSALQAAGLSTQRIEQLSNARVTVWHFHQTRPQCHTRLGPASC